MANLPCEGLADQMREFVQRSDDCWALADRIQYGASTAGVGAALACSAIIPTVGGPFGLGGGTVARDKLVVKCLAGVGGFLGGLATLDKTLDHCNDIDLQGEQVAKDWLACYKDHKEYLDSFHRPVS